MVPDMPLSGSVGAAFGWTVIVWLVYGGTRAAPVVGAGTAVWLGVRTGATPTWVRSTMAMKRWRMFVLGAPISGPSLTGVVVSSTTWKKPTVSHTTKTLLRVVTLLDSLVSISYWRYGCDSAVAFVGWNRLPLAA